MNDRQSRCSIASTIHLDMLPFMNRPRLGAGEVFVEQYCCVPRTRFKTVEEIRYHGHAALPLSAVFDFAGCHACRENDLRGDNNEGDQLRKALHLW